MMGKNHVITNIGSITILGCGLFALNKYTGPYSDVIQTGLQHVTTFVSPSETIVDIIWWGGAALLFWIGTLLPDIDKETSMFGRFFHLPIKHRTWTHSIWFLIALSFLCMFSPLFVFLVTGSFLHIFWDSVSYGGICWFYPISKYKSYSNGAMVKKKHILRLYRTGKSSEYVLIGVVVTLAVISVILSCYFGFIQT